MDGWSVQTASWARSESIRHRRLRVRKGLTRRSKKFTRRTVFASRIGTGFRSSLNMSCSTYGAGSSRRAEKYCRARWRESATITIWCGAVDSAARVVLLVIALILAGFDAGDPIAVGFEPIDGGLQSFFKMHLRFPSGFADQL